MGALQWEPVTRKRARPLYVYERMRAYSECPRHAHTHTPQSPITKGRCTRDAETCIPIQLYCAHATWLYVSPDAGVRVASATYILMVPRCTLMAPPRGVQHTSLPSRQRTDSGAS